jgi:hypothetical protein
MKFITKKNHLLNYFLNFLLAILIFSFRTLRKRHYVIAKITLVWLVPFFFLLITYPFIIHAGYDLNQDGRIDPFESCLRQEVGSACANPLGKLCDYHYPFTRYPVGAVRDASCTDTPPRCTAGISWGSDARVVCVQKGKCYNNDGDSRRNCPGWAQPEDKDCDDSDPWSHVFASANIASINIPAGISYSPLDYISGTITFTKKCGLTTPTPKALDISIYLVKPNGSEVHVGDRLYKKTDFVYEFSVGLSALFNEEDIALISKNPYGFKLKFVGPGLVDPYTGTTLPNKDRVIIKDIPKYASILMTNCAPVTLPWPIGERPPERTGKHKIVFLRGSEISLGKLTNTALVFAEDFNSRAPFNQANYNRDFSIFMDLDTYLPEKEFSLIKLDNGNLVFFNNYIPQGAGSCGRSKTTFGGPAVFNVTYLLITKKLDNKNSYASHGSKNAFLASSHSENRLEALHEFGHAFGGLLDEYIYPNPASDLSTSVKRVINFIFNLNDYTFHRNCSKDPFKDFSFNGVIYSSLFKEGLPINSDTHFCTFGYIGDKALGRPSVNSIMNNTTLSNRFNVVSCGWLLKAIKGGSAKSHFPECAEMAKRGEVEF